MENPLEMNILNFFLYFFSGRFEKEEIEAEPLTEVEPNVEVEAEAKTSANIMTNLSIKLWTQIYNDYFDF